VQRGRRRRAVNFGALTRVGRSIGDGRLRVYHIPRAEGDLQGEPFARGLVFAAAGVVALFGAVLGAYRRIDALPFAMTGVFFLSAFLSLAVMFWPYLIPYSVTVANAAAPDASLQFLFYGAVVVLPAIAVYTMGVYWVFRGKFHEERLDERSTTSEVAHRKGSIG